MPLVLSFSLPLLPLYTLSSDEAEQNLVHLFFYMADEEGNSISTGKDIDNFDGATLLTFGSREDVGRWELHLESKVWFLF